METIRVVQVGLGPIGNQLTRYLAQRRSVEVVGAVDIDPRKQGRDLGELAGVGELGVKVCEQLDEALHGSSATMAVLTTLSSLEAVHPQILDLTSKGLGVVSTCEELSYPWKTHPEIAGEIDEKARTAGVSVLGTGVNPGFLMDYLPLAASGACRSIDSIKIERIQDASNRRPSFHQKIGAGLDLQEFARKAESGTIRHVGFTESMHMIAARIGWDLERTEDVVEPVPAERRQRFGRHTIEPGQVLGIRQIGRGWASGREVLTLTFCAAMGQKAPHDRIAIQGAPSFEMIIPGGINGDIATCAIAANALPVVAAAPPGLRTMADLPVVSCLA